MGLCSSAALPCSASSLFLRHDEDSAARPPALKCTMANGLDTYGDEVMWGRWVRLAVLAILVVVAASVVADAAGAVGPHQSVPIGTAVLAQPPVFSVPATTAPVFAPPICINNQTQQQIPCPPNFAGCILDAPVLVAAVRSVYRCPPPPPPVREDLCFESKTGAAIVPCPPNFAGCKLSDTAGNRYYWQCIVVTATTITTTVPSTSTTTRVPVTTKPDVQGLSVEGADFGDVALGSESAPRDLKVTNTGTLEMRFQGAAMGGPFAVTGGTCQGTTSLPPRSVCTVGVVFRPTVAGPQSGKIQVTAIAPAGPLSAEGGLAGAGAVARLVFEPALLDLGAAPVGVDVAPKTLFLRNSGTTAVTVSKLVPAPGSDIAFEITQCTGATLAPGSSCPVNVSSRPAVAGARSRSIAALGTRGEAAAATARSRGLRRGITITPAVDLGSTLVGSATVSKNATVKNVGDTTVVITKVEVTNTVAGSIRVGTDGCTTTVLKPGATCVLAIDGIALAPGATKATVTVTGAAKESGQSAVRLNGTSPTTLAPTTVASITLAPTTAAPTTAPPPVTVAALHPTLLLSPPVVSAGKVTVAHGDGFPPNTAVILAWQGRGPLVSVTTDSHGTFVHPILLLPNEAVGPRLLTAVDHPPLFSGVSAALLVQLNTFRPPGSGGPTPRMVGRG